MTPNPDNRMSGEKPNERPILKACEVHDTPMTMACWRDGKWHADELANLAAKLERELKQYRDCAPCRHEWYLGQCAHCGITSEEFRK